MLVPAEAAFFDAEIATELVAGFCEKHQLPMLLCTAPPGVGGDIFSAPVMATFCERQCSVEELIAFRPDCAESDPQSKGVFHHFPEDVTGHRGRYTVDSRTSPHSTWDRPGIPESAPSGA